MRRSYALLFYFCSFLLAMSFILQLWFHQIPCNLCILDRILVMFLVLLYAVAYMHHPGKVGHRLYLLCASLLAWCGILITGRHLWLLANPSAEPDSCNPTLSYLINTLPLNEVLTILFHGTGECVKSSTHLLGLSLPAWTMVGFIVIAVGNILSIKKG